MRVIEFVGRTEELRQLQERRQEALAAQGSVVLVRGEVGVGKTRLVKQFASLARGDGVAISEGRWYESRQPAYVGFRECLLQLLQQDPVRTSINPDDPYVRNLVRLGEEFAEALGLDATGLADSEEPYGLWRGVDIVLRAAARAAPTILVLDDLQWADQGSLELLGFLGRDVAEMRLLIVAAYREDDVDGQHPLMKTVWDLRQSRSLAVLNLHGLRKEETATLAEHVAGARVDGQIMEPLYELTQGNPLFVEEMVRHLVSREAASPARAPDSLVALLGKDIPEGIREVMARRLSVLTAECQYFLQLAACVGRHFDFSLIGQVEELSQPALLALTTEAIQASIVEESTPGLFFFSHPLTREVVYNGIPAPGKMATHQRVAMALEAQYGSTATAHAQEIAHHLVSAGSLADPRRTAVYCVEGMRQARAAFAFNEARRLALAALGAIERLGMDLPRLRAHLLLQLGYAEAVSGCPDEAVQRYRDALSIYEALGEEEGRTDAYRWLTTGCLRYGRWREAFAAARDGLAGATEKSTHAFVGLAGAYVMALLVAGRTDESAAWAEKVLKLAFDGETRAVAHHAAAAQHTWGIKDPAEATRHFELSRDFFLKEGRDPTSAQVALDHAITSYFLGEFETSREAARESERLGNATGRASVIADLSAFQTLLFVHQGEWDRAHEALTTWEDARSSLGGSTIYGQFAQRAGALERFWKRGPAGVSELLDSAIAFPLSNQPLEAFIHAEAGERGEALELMEKLKAVIPARGRGLFWLSGALPLLATSSTLGLDSPACARPLGRYRGRLFDWFLVDVELGREAAGRRSWEEAHAHFLRATEVCEAAGLRGFLGQAYLHHGLMFISRRQSGDRKKGVALLEQAGALFSDLRLDYLCAKVQAIVARPTRGRPMAHGPAGLTERELAVLRLVADGQSNRQIAETLYISEKTVERHLENIYPKIEVNSRAAAITWLLRQIAEAN